MGCLPDSPLEVRLAATLFLILLGAADLFAAWQVHNFASFAPREVARLVAPGGRHAMGGAAAAARNRPAVTEVPVDLDELDRPARHIEHELLVQDTHVHIPAYALTAAALCLVVFGLRLSSAVRSGLVVAAFAAPFADFAGLWGAHLAPGAGTAFASLAVAGGFLMGAAYMIVAALTFYQCWLQGRQGART
jgi:hypothetical protein